jgi:hypothetical protein
MIPNGLSWIMHPESKGRIRNANRLMSALRIASGRGGGHF